MTKKNLNSSKLTWTFLDGSTRSAVVLESVAIGRGKYLPGWKWSKHVGVMTGKQSEAHIGYIVSGKMTIEGPDGVKMQIGPGDAFEIGPGHDAWVDGDEPCIAMDFEYLGKK